MKTRKISCALLVTVLLCFFMCSCGEESIQEESIQEEENEQKTEYDLKEEFRNEVYAYGVAYCKLSYQDVKTVEVNLVSINVDQNIYTGKGKVVIYDDYGDKYVGKITAVYRLEEKDDGQHYFHYFIKDSVDIETPRKE